MGMGANSPVKSEYSSYLSPHLALKYLYHITQTL